MGVIRAILMVLFVLVCIALTVVVLMQEGKSNGLGAIAGGNSFWEQNKSRSAEGKIVLATKILAIAFIVLALVLNLNIFNVIDLLLLLRQIKHSRDDRGCFLRYGNEACVRKFRSACRIYVICRRNYGRQDI